MILFLYLKDHDEGTIHYDIIFYILKVMMKEPSTMLW